MTSSRGFLRTLVAGGRRFNYFSVEAAAQGRKLPRSIRVLLENQLRHMAGAAQLEDMVRHLAQYAPGSVGAEMLFWPSRVLMQEAAGLPGMLDLASMRAQLAQDGRNPRTVNPRIPVDLVIDHSVMVDRFGSRGAFQANLDLEYRRNAERYSFLKWAQQSFRNFRVVPPGQGICHQINIEHLATVVAATETADGILAYPDTVLGTDSHTTMVNALSVLGWGVGAIEAEIAMMGQPVSMLVPQVVGVRLAGALPVGSSVTDAVLTLTQMLRRHGVVGRFVEFFGPGVSALTLADRATLANMAPDYGATCGYFPVDEETLRYLAQTGRSDEHVALVGAYAKAQGLWQDAAMPALDYSEVLTFDLSSVEPSVAGPGRPEQRIALSHVAKSFMKDNQGVEKDLAPPQDGLVDGAIVIAAITSCTNTSNPSAMVGAGLLARNAVRKGLRSRPWVKTSLSPGSRVVADYLAASGLEAPLRELGFDTVGFGCMTCVGNSGPLSEEISRRIVDDKLHAVSVLSGNRNFEARIHRLVRSNYLCSPALVVAYALCGNIAVDLAAQPLGVASDGSKVYLKDIWPDRREVEAIVRREITSEMFVSSYDGVFQGDARWQELSSPRGDIYAWDEESTYIKNPPFLNLQDHGPDRLAEIRGSRILAILGHQVTTDHISPVGEIAGNSPAGEFLQSLGVAPRAFNSYAARRANYEVMLRGTFANPRLQNLMVPERPGPFTRIDAQGQAVSIYEAAMHWRDKQVPTIIFAGRQYGTGSARDWAARGTRLLGVRAVVAESFERIHRSNLALMGVLPLELPAGVTQASLGLAGDETVDILGVNEDMAAPARLVLAISRRDGTTTRQEVVCRLDTTLEKDYYRAGGVLNYVFGRLASQKGPKEETV